MIFPGLLGIMTGQIWRCIEVVVTRLTRNQLTGNTVRGFESLHLRQKHKGLPVGRSLVLLDESSKGFEPEGTWKRAEGTWKRAGGTFQPEAACPAGQVESLHLRHSVGASYISLAPIFMPTAKKSEFAHSAAPPFKPEAQRLRVCCLETSVKAKSALRPRFLFHGE